MWDSLILMVIALVVFGPRKLPQIGRQVGKLMYEFRKASNDFKFQMEEELRNAEESDRRKQEEERLRTLALAAPAAIEAGSQVSEATTAAPAAVQSATAAMESYYPEQTQYPSPTLDAAADPPNSEEAYPRIRPPSTGEQVAAAKPNSHAARPDQAGAEAAVEARHDPHPAAEAALLPGANELRANESGPSLNEAPSPDPAQAAHHG